MSSIISLTLTEKVLVQFELLLCVAVILQLPIFLPITLHENPLLVGTNLTISGLSELQAIDVLGYAFTLII
jgi:hypothetical protein